MTREKQITPRQAVAIIASITISVGILTLPREAAVAAGTDAHLATLMGGLIGGLLLIFYTKLAQRFPNRSLIQYSTLALGSVLGKIIGLAFILYWLLLLTAIARFFGEMLITSILTNTPLEVTIIIMLLLGAQLAGQDVKVFARVNELFLPLIILPLLILLILSLPTIKYLHLLPVLAYGPGPILRGVLATCLSYLGIELVLILFPYYTEPQQALKYHLYGIALPILIYTLTVCATLGSFGVDTLQKLQWPTLEQIRITHIPGVFERLESAFVAVWVVTVFTSVGGFFFLITLSLTETLGLKQRNRFYHYLLIVPIFLLARYPQNIVQTELYIGMIANAGMILIVLVPILIYLAALVRKLKGGEIHNEKNNST